MRSLTSLTILVSVILCGGCADRTQVTALEKRVEELDRTVSELKQEVESLKQDRSLDELFKNMDAIAYLTPGAEGYSVVQTDLGRMTVSLANIQAYANGSRVTLRFGNLTSATVTGAKATIEWGSVDAKGKPRNEPARSREVTFTQSLRAGAWTSVTVVLEGVPPTELGFVRIKDVAHRGISLLR